MQTGDIYGASYFVLCTVWRGSHTHMLSSEVKLLSKAANPWEEHDHGDLETFLWVCRKGIFYSSEGLESFAEEITFELNVNCLQAQK